MLNSDYNLIAIIGPTASGKTGFAAHLASSLKGEIISGDSRQIYTGMDIGTGKDLEDYTVEGKLVPYHLIDIVPAGSKYNVYQFQTDFIKAFKAIQTKNKWPVLCGGTGLYVEAVLKGYKLLNVPVNKALREDLADKPLADLGAMLKKYKTLHNNTDTDTVRRAIRAIEIEEYYLEHDTETFDYPVIKPLLIGVDIERDLRREKITKRLHQRLEEGMVDEVKKLLDSGIPSENLIYYGLEYKFLTQYVLGDISYDVMVHDLEIAIHQFAKRQMTWFRGMERRGMKIEWVSAALSNEEKIAFVTKLLKPHA